MHKETAQIYVPFLEQFFTIWSKQWNEYLDQNEDEAIPCAWLLTLIKDQKQ